MTVLDSGALINVLKLARAAGVDADRRGLSFRLGSTSDEWSSDGGPPAASTFYDWAAVYAGGEKVMSTHPRLQVEGPWLDDLPAVLAEIKTEAEIILAEMERQQAHETARHAEEEARAAMRAREQQTERYLRERG